MLSALSSPTLRLVATVLVQMPLEQEDVLEADATRTPVQAA